MTAVIGGGEFGDVCRASLNIVMLRRMDVQLASNTFDKEVPYERERDTV